MPHIRFHSLLRNSYPSNPLGMCLEDRESSLLKTYAMLKNLKLRTDTRKYKKVASINGLVSIK